MTVSHWTFITRISSKKKKKLQLPTESVKDGRPLSAKKDRYTLIEQSATLIEQSKNFLKGVPKRYKKAKTKVA